MIDYAKIETETVERSCKYIAMGMLQSGGPDSSHDEIVKRIGCYLRKHVGLDPAHWTWRVLTPWRGNMLTTWGPEDVRVVIEPRSAVEQLAALATR